MAEPDVIKQWKTEIWVSNLTKRITANVIRYDFIDEKSKKFEDEQERLGLGLCDGGPHEVTVRKAIINIIDDSNVIDLETIQKMVRLTIDKSIKIDEVMNKVLSDGIINYGRILTFMAYVRGLRKELTNIDNVVIMEFEKLACDVANNCFNQYILDNGGWNKFLSECCNKRISRKRKHDGRLV